MNRFSSKFISFVFRHPVAVVVTTGIVFLASLAVLPSLRIDNSVDVFFNKEGSNYLNFEQWKEQFGSDEIIIIALEADDIFVRKNLQLIDQLTQSFESLEYVANVTSLTTVNNILGQEQDLIIERLLQEIPATSQAMAALKAQATEDDLYAGNVISKDGRVTAIIVELENVQGENNEHKKQVIEKVFAVLRRDVPADITFHVSGPTVIEHFYAAYMQDDFKTFMPFLFLMIIAVMYLSFRSVKLVALPLLLIIISVTFSMALLHLLGYSVNNVTTIIPPILMAIMIAESVHIIGEGMERCRQNTGDREYRFLEETMNHLFFACFLTSITTSVGFWSLATNKIPPVRQLGIVVGFGVFFALLCTFTFLPALAKLWDAFDVARPVVVSKPVGSNKFDTLLKWIGRMNEHHYRAILWIAAAISVLSIFGMLQIKVETSVIEYFKKSSPVYRATTFIEEHLSGVHIINVSLQAAQPDYFKNPQALTNIQQLTEFLQTIPEVDKVTSVNDYLKEINKSFHNENPEFYLIPESQQMVAQYVLLYGREDLEDFIDDQWQWATVRVRLKEHSTVKLAGVIKQIQDYIQTQTKDLEQAQVVGQTVLEVESNNAVANGQISSLGSAMFGVFLMMFLALRSIPVGIVSVIPNVLPLLMNFGIMGLLGIRLDSTTSMIAAIAIGIVVDDTIHFLFGFGEALEEEGNDYTTAMYKTLEQRGRPITVTAVILFFGFGILSVSKFVPTAYFGLLSSLLMLYALIAELFVTPSLILCFKPSFKKLTASSIRSKILNSKKK